MNKADLLKAGNTILLVALGVLLADVAKQQIAKIKISRPLEVSDEV